MLDTSNIKFQVMMIWWAETGVTQVFIIISLWFIIRVVAFLSKSSRQAEGKQQTSNELRLSVQMLQPTNKRLLNQSCCQNKLEYSQASDSLTARFQLTAGVSDGLSQQCPALSVWVIQLLSWQKGDCGEHPVNIAVNSRQRYTTSACCHVTGAQAL